ncbi:hypothetical protein B0T14DRAFT_491070 [Immersiella caudata]|uniref:DUF7726 domain-containing protein n=1 Tax=Immersiella caudata TaxID=314043 RepID=A0AA39XF21_9PEZI|nr:hypothetical protein B0T14DRAFT_491070 [Immersiella caudata]
MDVAQFACRGQTDPKHQTRLCLHLPHSSVLKLSVFSRNHLQTNFEPRSPPRLSCSISTRIPILPSAPSRPPQTTLPNPPPPPCPSPPSSTPTEKTTPSFRPTSKAPSSSLAWSLKCKPLDINVEDLPIDQNCDQVRRKIKRFLDAGEMTKTAFAKEIGVSMKSLNNFLAELGAYKGSGSSSYDQAWDAQGEGVEGGGDAEEEGCQGCWGCSSGPGRFRCGIGGRCGTGEEGGVCVWE